MNRKRVSEAWVWSSLEDLYFGFNICSEQFRPYKIFSEIMALEKLLKALLLYYDGDLYEKECERRSTEVIENQAKKYGHNIKKMLTEASKHFGKEVLVGLKEADFDGFTGSEIIRAIEAGYEESRYPTLKPICEEFKVKGLDIYRDPLGSSGVTKFVYSASRMILLHLNSITGTTSINQRFMQTFGDWRGTGRFIDLAFEGSIDKYL